jgi:hypothetical protein
LSGVDTNIRAAFARARSFITPYAASGIDEYMAEGARAYVEINDGSSPWPKATRERLKSIDPAMYDIIERIFTPPVVACPIAVHRATRIEEASRTVGSSNHPRLG